MSDRHTAGRLEGTQGRATRGTRGAADEHVKVWRYPVTVVVGRSSLAEQVTGDLDMRGLPVVRAGSCRQARRVEDPCAMVIVPPLAGGGPVEVATTADCPVLVVTAGRFSRAHERFLELYGVRAVLSWPEDDARLHHQLLVAYGDAMSSGTADDPSRRVQAVLETCFPDLDLTVVVFGNVAIVCGRVRTREQRARIEVIVRRHVQVDKVVSDLPVR